MWNLKRILLLLICGILKKDTNEFIYKMETDLRTLKIILWLPKTKGGERGRTGSLGWHMHTTVCGMDS